MKWIKARASQGCSNCVEATVAGDEIWVRNSRHPDGPALRFKAGLWSSFLDAVKMTRAAVCHGSVVLAKPVGDRWLMFREDDPAVTLQFTDGEVDAFVTGVCDGEFDLDRLAAAARS